jgi:type I restriction enzyme S subunit
LKRLSTVSLGERRGKRKREAAIEPPMLLPEGWVFVSIEQIAQLVTDGDHNPPKRTTTGIPHLTAKHVRDWRLEPADSTFISRTDAERVFKRYRPEPGDLIVTCVGTVGRTAIVPDGYEFSPDRNLAAVRPVPGSVSVRFLQAVLESPLYQEIIRSASGSTAQPHLYLGDLRAIAIPLPPHNEQRRIVNEIELQFSIWVALETQIDSLVQRAQRAREALLMRAYAR